MLTNFSGVDLNEPVTKLEEAEQTVNKTLLYENLADYACEMASDGGEALESIGLELLRQYEAMNEDQRKGFQAGLIALTGYTFNHLVEEAISRTEYERDHD